MCRRLSKSYSCKKTRKNIFIVFFRNIDFFRIAITEKGGRQRHNARCDKLFLPLWHSVCVYMRVYEFVCVCVCKRGIDTFCDKFWRFERNEYSRQSSDEGKWNVFKVKFFGLQFRRHIFFDLDIVWGRPLMTSRNFGQFSTPPLPIVLFKRPSFCRQKFLDPHPPKTSTSFMDHPFDKFWKSWEKALLSNWS